MKRVLITTMVIQCPGSSIDYIAAGRRMISSYLKHTPHNVLVVTNEPKAFEDIKEEYGRNLIISYIPTSMSRFKRFDYTLKLEAIAQASTADVDVVYWVDADQYTTGWDEDSFQECLSLPCDVIGCPGALYLRNKDEWQNNPGDHPMVAVDGAKGFYSHGESYVIYNNIDTLRRIVHFWQTSDWDKGLSINPDNPETNIATGEVIEHWRTKEGCDGIMMGMGLYLAKGVYHRLSREEGYRFAEYETVVQRANHNRAYERLLDRWYIPHEEQ